MVPLVPSSSGTHHFPPEAEEGREPEPTDEIPASRAEGEWEEDRSQRRVEEEREKSMDSRQSENRDTPGNSTGEPAAAEAPNPQKQKARISSTEKRNKKERKKHKTAESQATERQRNKIRCAKPKAE